MDGRRADSEEWSGRRWLRKWRTKEGRKINHSFQAFFCVEFMSGLKQTVASTWVESRRSLDEGKKGMSYEVYEHVCQIP